MRVAGFASAGQAATAAVWPFSAAGMRRLCIAKQNDLTAAVLRCASARWVRRPTATRLVLAVETAMGAVRL